jgi:hypothetical protein
MKMNIRLFNYGEEWLITHLDRRRYVSIPVIEGEPLSERDKRAMAALQDAPQR